MIEIKQAVAGREAIIRVPENEEDLQQYYEWMKAPAEGAYIAIDTETTGLDIFSPDFRVRTLQVGIGLEAWVLPVEEMERDVVIEILRDLSRRFITLQNAAYDWLAIRQCYGVILPWCFITDTKILAHLLDSRAKKEGGFGHSLQELTAEFLDPVVAEEVKGSMMRLRNETKLSKDEIWKEIDLWNETYLRYAGMDVVLTYALRNILTRKLKELKAKVPEFNTDLIRYEHEVARVCAEMEFNGFLLDHDYARGLSDQLMEEQEVWEAIALLEFGTESVNANAQVAADLIDSGVRLNEITASGAYKLDKTILEPLAEEGHLLAQAVVQAKKAKKWRTSWVDKFLDGSDASGRVHANINPLLARTARMSITGIPAQTLPSSGWSIRRCFIPAPGNSIVACDYQAQELRVLAAISKDANMQQAFRENADLHTLTASASGVSRKVGKTVNFAYVYGSGAGNIAETCDITVPKAREVIKGFERTYPGVKKLSDRLQQQAKAKGYIVTAFGRVIRTDTDRPYAALNYMVQSSSRDITARALLRLDKAGFTPYLRLPIHDEILAEVPEERAKGASEKIARIMEEELYGVLIASDAEVLGKSWGGGYINPDDPQDQIDYEATFK